MENSTANPCMACDVNQKCCRTLSGLRLSADEFERHFKYYSDKLTVLKYKKTFIVSVRGDNPCPHWSQAGCTIYEHRPIDCRLFPYELVHMAAKWKKIEVAFHGQTDCPHRKELFLPVEEAKELLRVLAHKVHGSEKQVVIRFLSELEYPLRRPRFYDPLVSRISKIIRSYR